MSEDRDFLEATEERLLRDLTGPSHGVDRVSAAKQLKAVRAQLAEIGDAVGAGDYADLKRRVLAIQEGMR